MTFIFFARNSGPEFAEIPPRNFFYQKLKSASDREFYSLYDAIHEFKKIRILMKPENRIL
jgi:hypothetical protein